MIKKVIKYLLYRANPATETLLPHVEYKLIFDIYSIPTLSTSRSLVYTILPSLWIRKVFQLNKSRFNQGKFLVAH
jgi:hypothetical protein